MKNQARIFALPLLFVPIGTVALTGCQPKEKEKIVYIEVPVEKITNTETQVAGETVTVTNTIEKEKIVTQTLPLTVDEAVVTINPGALALSTGISLIPSKTEDVGGLGLRSFGLRSTAAESDFDKFEEEVVIWNPAQEPLKNVNNYLCLIGKTGYNQAAAKDHAVRLAADQKAKIEVDVTYIAKITVSDCLSRGSSMGGKQNESKKAPIDFTVKLFKEKDKPLSVSIWYGVKISDLAGGAGGMIQGGMNSGSNDVRNYYLHLKVAEPVSSENPFGLFDLEGESFDVKNSVEEVSKASNFYVKVYRKPITNDLLLNFYDKNKTPNAYASDWSSFVENQAKAVLDVKALMDENKNVTGYEIKGGDAHTALNYSWNYTGNDPNQTVYSGGGDNSGSYSLAFDEDYIITKYNLGVKNHRYGTFGSGFNPEAPTCATRNENWANVWEYSIFDAEGQRISQPNGFMIKTGKIHPEWKYPITGWFSRWGMYLSDTSDGETVHLVNWYLGTETPYIYTVFKGKLLDNNWQDLTVKQSTNLTLTCSSNCPKTLITQDDINNNSLTLSGGPYTYVFDANSKSLKENGVEVRFAPGVTTTGTSFEWAWTMIDASMVDGDGNNFRYQMSLNSNNKASGLRVKNADGTAGAFFVLPDPIQFEPFTYVDANHAYKDNGNTGVVPDFNFVYDGYLMGINWEAKPGRKDQWNNDMWAPQVTLKKGVELIVANDTGNFKQGDKIKLAPKVAQHTAKSRNFLIMADAGVERDGCNLSLQERANWIKAELALPQANASQDTKGKVGVKPLKGADNKDLPVLFTEGISL